ncbi:hypothetical protein BS50DRAFT_576188 [Corynespora cassiicola Philippines]|uniref:Uncharacterized protein n=1 Tax=Corynespora cassiicola Philippines TaxID=1448308 RepID=A0A2T2NDT9_CORCC|nr:hypothetical protein BS50DRAFT_576188 [Corynespora cassiicola Philippines]
MSPPNTSQASSASAHPFLSTVLNLSHAPPAPMLTTPTRSSSSNRLASTSNQASTSLTPAQQALQARNQPYDASPGASSSAETKDQRERREKLATILENDEMLIWFSGARNESVSQTRQHFQNVVLGLEDHAVGVFWPEEWEVPIAERITKDRERAIASPARSAKGKEKVKKRS